MKFNYATRPLHNPAGPLRIDKATPGTGLLSPPKVRTLMSAWLRVRDFGWNSAICSWYMTTLLYLLLRVRDVFSSCPV